MDKNASSPGKTGSIPKLALGLSLLILGLILFFGRQKAVQVLSQSFATEPVRVSGFFSEKSEGASLPKRVVIPQLSIDLQIKSSKIINGYWEVFPDAAGWGEGSGIPGEMGNQVIFAHAREGLFMPMKNAVKGLKIYILTEGEFNLSNLPEDLSKALIEETGKDSLRRSNWYSYEVVEIKEVFPSQTEVIEPTDDETLTLYTCSGFADSKRLILIAKRT